VVIRLLEITSAYVTLQEEQAPAHLLCRCRLLLGVGGGRTPQRRRLRRRGSAAFARFRAGLGALRPALAQLSSILQISVKVSSAQIRLLWPGMPLHALHLFVTCTL